VVAEVGHVLQQHRTQLLVGVPPIRFAQAGGRLL
jgi:hypothetical protein